MTKLWQMMQRRDTKNLNSDRYLDEILTKIKQTGWNESTRTERKKKEKSNNRHSPGLKPQMESILFLVAEWASVKELKALQGACMRTFTVTREQQFEALPSSLDDQVWKELSDDWQR